MGIIGLESKEDRYGGAYSPSEFGMFLEIAPKRLKGADVRVTVFEAIVESVEDYEDSEGVEFSESQFRRLVSYLETWFDDYVDTLTGAKEILTFVEELVINGDWLDNIYAFVEGGGLD